MPSLLIIECKQFGRSRPVVLDFSVPIPPEWELGGDTLRLRNVVAHIVREEIRAFEHRQWERRLIQVLTNREIQHGAQAGKITMGGSDLGQEVDPDGAVGTALQAFEDGLYYVFVDDDQQTDLDAPICLQPESRFTFLRLVALAGG